MQNILSQFIGASHTVSVSSAVKEILQVNRPTFAHPVGSAFGDIYFFLKTRTASLRIDLIIEYFNDNSLHV